MIEMVSHGLANLEVYLIFFLPFNQTSGSLSELISGCNDDNFPPNIVRTLFLQVTLKHSGSLFMYAGHHGGAYAKNSYGNVYVLLISPDYFKINISGV